MESTKRLTVAEAYGRRFGVEAGAFARHVLPRLLYPQARMLGVLARGLESSFFDPDREFAEVIGRARSSGEVMNAIDEFSQVPANRKFWRRTMRLRASAGKVWRLWRELVRPDRES